MVEFSASLPSGVLREGIPGTKRPLYRTNLSHKRLIKCLDQLKEGGLLELTPDEDKTSYVITSKGDKFVMEFKRMEEFADAFGLDI